MYVPDDEQPSIILLFILIIHVLLILLRAANVVYVPWVIILIPEILFMLGIAAITLIATYFVLRERVGRRKENGK